MKLECWIYKKNGMPLPEPEVHEAKDFYYNDEECLVNLKNGVSINMINAHIHHASIPESMLGLSIHGVESCPDLHGAGVSQELWIRYGVWPTNIEKCPHCWAYFTDGLNHECPPPLVALVKIHEQKKNTIEPAPLE